MSKTTVKTELGYQVPSMFFEREVRLKYLKDAGIKNPRLSDGKFLYFLNTLRVTSHIHRSRYGDTKGWVALSKEITKPESMLIAKSRMMRYSSAPLLATMLCAVF